MRALILAAGYATRMHPLTLNRAKPLLPVGGRTVIDHVVDGLAEVTRLQEIVVVANHRFAADFERWAATRDAGPDLCVLDDGSEDDANRLGAIGDIHFAVCSLGIAEELLVVAADNLLPFSLAGMIGLFDRTGTDVISAYHQPDPARLRRTGVATLDEHGRVTTFAEKPAHPISQWAVPPVYVFTADTVADVGRYLSEGNDPDAPGNFTAWLCARKPVHAFVFEDPPLDIGDVESYRRADRLLSGGDTSVEGDRGC